MRRGRSEKPTDISTSHSPPPKTRLWFLLVTRRIKSERGVDASGSLAAGRSDRLQMQGPSEVLGVEGGER